MCESIRFPFASHVRLGPQSPGAYMPKARLGSSNLAPNSVYPKAIQGQQHSTQPKSMIRTLGSAKKQCKIAHGSKAFTLAS